MKKKLTPVLALILLAILLLPLCVLGEEEKAADAAPLPKDNLVETTHSVTIKGTPLEYTATTGTICMHNDLGDYEVFFTAYNVEAPDDASPRPITFIFNGGPGSSSVWLHMGLFSPRKVALDADGMVVSVPTVTRENEYSLLDITDLVFIDPVGTGYSRALPGTEENTFYSLEGDCVSVSDFIRLYISRYNRWASPKYLAGESFGTARAIYVCDYLQSCYHIALNGIILISCANDYSALQFSGSNDLPYASFVPSYAAAAWYHHRLNETYQNMSLDDFLSEVRKFTAEEYQPALYKGTSMTQDETRAVAARLAAYIGLKEEDILDKNLRIQLNDFTTLLLKDEGKVIGRYDSRYTGSMMTGNAGTYSDPSDNGVGEAFASAFNDYLARSLEYTTDRFYETLSNDVNYKWQFGLDNQIFCQEDTIHDCLAKNDFLKIWVVSGQYDLATPFFATEWVYNHLFLNESQQSRLSFTYYPSGHMFYNHEPSMIQFREHAESWYGAASK